MSTEVRLRQDTAVNVGTYTLASGELGYKTDTKEIVVGDGSTVGGNAIAKKSQVDSLSTTVSTHTTQIETANTNISNNSGVISSHTNELSVTTPNTNYAAALAAQQDRELAAFIQNYKQQKSFVNLLPSDPTTFTRASSATYFDANGVMQIAASGVKRYTHDPVTLQPLGIMIEDQRTNIFLRSNELTNSFWSKSGVTVTDLTTHVKVIPDTTTSSHYLGKNSGLSITSGQSYCIGGEFKADEHKYLQIIVTSSGFGATVISAFDLESGTLLQPVAGVNAKAVMQNMGDGWWRCFLIVEATATDVAASYQFRPTPAFSVSLQTFNGNAVDGLYMRNMQMEAGYFPTSYIPTASAAVTRVADTITDTVNTATYLNGSRGTVFADFYVPYLNTSGSGADGRQVVWRIRHIATNNFIELLYENGKLQVLAWDGSASAYSPLTGVIVTTQRNKVAVAYAVVGGVLTPVISINGATVAGVAKSGFSMPSPVLYIGTEGSTRQLGGTISRLNYFKRVMTQAELNEMTA